MESNKSQMSNVINTLASFDERIENLLILLEDKKSTTPGENEILQKHLRMLKNDLKLAAMVNPSNVYEESYLAPALQSASANLTIAINSHPISSNWYSCLYGVRIDISHLLEQLRAEFAVA